MVVEVAVVVEVKVEDDVVTLVVLTELVVLEVVRVLRTT